MNPAQNYVSPQAFEQAMGFYQQQLAGWPVPAEQRIVPTRIGDTFVLVFGSAGFPPLVLLHGSASNSGSWAMDASAFARCFRVFAVDLPGETGKSTGTRPPYEGSSYAKWLSDVFDQLGLERASICGLSLGGWAGLKFAAAYAARVERLAVLAPGGVAPARQSFTDEADVALAQGEDGIRAMAAAVFAPQPPPPGVAEAFVFMHSIYKARRDDLPILTDDELRAIAAPTLLIGGAQDAVLDMAATEARMRLLVPRFASAIDPEGGHALIGRAEQVVAFLSAD